MNGTPIDLGISARGAGRRYGAACIRQFTDLAGDLSSNPNGIQSESTCRVADRAGQGGVSATTYKVATSETKGDLFVIEQQNQRRGGPPLHVHHGEDELFYVLDGEYLVQVGDKRYTLTTGDCILGPRGVPHAWAFAGATTGRLLLSYAPAGKMEAFFNAWEKLGFSPGGYSKEKDAALLESYGMRRMGPPIQL